MIRLQMTNRRLDRLSAPEAFFLGLRHRPALASVQDSDTGVIRIHAPIAQINDHLPGYRSRVLQQDPGLFQLCAQHMTIIWVACKRPGPHDQPLLVQRNAHILGRLDELTSGNLQKPAVDLIGDGLGLHRTVDSHPLELFYTPSALITRALRSLARSPCRAVPCIRFLSISSQIAPSRFLPTLVFSLPIRREKTPHVVALGFTRCDQLVAGLAPAGVRPCWAHQRKPPGWGRGVRVSPARRQVMLPSD